MEIIKKPESELGLKYIVIRDRIGRYLFIPVGMADCSGFVYRIIGGLKKNVKNI